MSLRKAVGSFSAHPILFPSLVDGFRRFWAIFVHQSYAFCCLRVCVCIFFRFSESAFTLPRIVGAKRAFTNGPGVVLSLLG